MIHAEATVHDCVLGPWTWVGARTSLSEVSTYADIGKFCSIANVSRSVLDAARARFGAVSAGAGLGDLGQPGHAGATRCGSRREDAAGIKDRLARADLFTTVGVDVVEVANNGAAAEGVAALVAAIPG